MGVDPLAVWVSIFIVRSDCGLTRCEAHSAHASQSIAVHAEKQRIYNLT